MDIFAYLKRIGLETVPAADADGLARVHYHHLLHVPFENLSIHTNEPIKLNDAHLLDKIIRRNRGGLCYELNGAFAWLLRHMGFRIHLVSAEVALHDDTYSPRHDHMAIFVDGDIPMLADVGFGDFFRYPLQLVPNFIQHEPGRAYKLLEKSNKFILQQKILDEPWINLFRFSLEPYGYADFQGMCSFHENSLESHFSKTPIASLATADGRITVSGQQFIRTGLNGSRTELAIEDKHQFDQLLKEHFGIDLMRN